MLKKCKHCGRELEANEQNFTRCKTSKDGWYYICKECKNKEKREYYQKHKDEIRLNNAIYRLNNKEKVASWLKKSQLKNKDKISAYAKAYYQEHRNEIRAQQNSYYKGYYQEHKDEQSARNKKWRSENKELLKEWHKAYKRTLDIPVNTNPDITKRCGYCGRELPATLEYFHRDKARKHGISFECKECRSKRDKQRYNEPNTDESITRKCSYCGRELPATLEYFGRSSRNKYGVNYRCKDCAKKMQAKYKED